MPSGYKTAKGSLALCALLLGASPAGAEPNACFPGDGAEDGPVCRQRDDPVGDILRVLEPLRMFSGYRPRIQVFYISKMMEVAAETIGPNVPPNQENVAKIAVSAGMLDACQTDAELAFVMAHELSHLAAGDTRYFAELAPKLLEEWMETPEGKEAHARVLADASIPEDQRGAAYYRLFAEKHINPKKKVAELEADINALNLMSVTDANGDGEPDYDLGAAISFLKTVKIYHPGHDNLALSGTHPTVTQRIAVAEQIKGFFVDGGAPPTNVHAVLSTPDAEGKTRKGRLQNTLSGLGSALP